MSCIKLYTFIYESYYGIIVLLCYFMYENNSYNVNKCNNLLLEQLIPLVYATSPSSLPSVYTADCRVCTQLRASWNPRPRSSDNPCLHLSVHY
ncbi:hypothetical protein C0J52_14814 [Blattella germanica]|nr:hypothetical protein C0J52_14814 [Blattella germanica]